MINQNDLYDMTFAFIKIRDDIQEELNSEILSRIIYVLSDENKFDDNQIRKAIASIEGLNYKKWFYVYHNNIYTVIFANNYAYVAQFLGSLHNYYIYVYMAF